VLVIEDAVLQRLLFATRGEAGLRRRSASRCCTAASELHLSACAVLARSLLFGVACTVRLCRRTHCDSTVEAQTLQPRRPAAPPIPCPSKTTLCRQTAAVDVAEGRQEAARQAPSSLQPPHLQGALESAPCAARVSCSMRRSLAPRKYLWRCGCASRAPSQRATDTDTALPTSAQRSACRARPRPDRAPWRAAHAYPAARLGAGLCRHHAARLRARTARASPGTAHSRRRL